MRGDVRHDEGRGVFDLGQAFVDLALECAGHNLPQFSTAFILSRLCAGRQLIFDFIYF